jgi:AhpD family alkylhydroperoxidase
MLPDKIRYSLFDYMSVKTMRYVTAVPTREATGLTKHVYDMIKDDFFKNGSLTSRSRVPALMAAIWTAGREAMLVEDQVDRTTKDAITAVLSQVNDCPYCEDMLVSLVHAGGDHDTATDIASQNNLDATDPAMRERLNWVRNIATPSTEAVGVAPFVKDQLPEVLGSLMAMSDINRFSHVVMEDSPLNAPLGVRAIKAAALKAFGSELETTRRRPLVPGRALGLLPPAELPKDMNWARANPRVADALARWASTVERETSGVISTAIKEAVDRSLQRWEGEQMPISRSWVETDVEGLDSADKSIAKLAIVLAKAPYQVDETMAEAVLVENPDEEWFVRVLAWASFTGARRVAQIMARKVTYVDQRQQAVA